jgi:uncharacterized protein (TIGR02646 family)
VRRIVRPALPGHTQAFLDRRQKSVNDQYRLGVLNIDRDWKAARRSQSIKLVLRTLQQAMGPRERCMYCLDSHGSDIEHFRPKARFPKHAYRWKNLLLCCTECGRHKGSQFPKSNGRVLLIDPTVDDPWLHLDFDPATGNLTARFDLAVNDWSIKGSTTVQVLQLDRREALAAGYTKTYRRLVTIVQDALAKLTDGAVTSSGLWAALRDADDHGLLPWCLRGNGQNLTPFADLRELHASVWLAGVKAFK